MKLEDVYSNLCKGDIRHPFHMKIYKNNLPYDEYRCDCINCLSDRTPLAQEILRLRELIDDTQKAVKELAG